MDFQVHALKITNTPRLFVMDNIMNNQKTRYPTEELRKQKGISKNYFEVCVCVFIIKLCYEELSE